MRLSAMIVVAISLFSCVGTGEAREAERAAARLSPALASYYPHWVTRDGEVTSAIMNRLAPGTMIGAHHEWSLDAIRRILRYPGKRFKISWYVEANVAESDDPTPVGTTVAKRIDEARHKQALLVDEFGGDRFPGLIELNGSRDKKDGNLDGPGNRPSDWLADAEAVSRAGFRYIAKSPAPWQVDELRARLGRDFVPRIVFEDVTASPGASNPGYRRDAAALAKRGEILTLIVHSGAYGGFPSTSLRRARAVMRADFVEPRVEAYWGRAKASDGFVKLKSFDAAASEAVARHH
ncbi:MAG: hypothetical protein R3D44_02445 [Hyphomicrobiaceae bacterium]